MAKYLGTKIDVLDYGHVTLVDYLGDDEAITQAARVSYGAGTKTVQDDRNLIRYLVRHRHCYRGDMQVLTSLGWTRWDELTNRAIFLVPNIETGKYQPEELDIKKFYNTDSVMYTYENNKMSFAVTDNHKMRFKPKGSSDYKIFSIQDMPKWGHFDPASNYSLVSPNGSKDPKAMFVGFFLGDGSWASKNTITFNLKKDRKHEYLRDLLDKLNLQARLRATNNGSICYTIDTPAFLYEWVSQGKAKDKGLIENKLSELYKLKDDQIRGLFDGLLNSDGSKKKDRPQLEFSSSSLKLVNLFELLSTILGLESHHVKGFSDMFNIKTYTGDKNSLESRAQYHAKPYSTTETVYCATTSTGWLMVRGGEDRFGFVCGNTSPLEMVVFKFHCKMPIFVARQWVRHRTASLNEISARYSEMKDEFYKPEPEQVRLQSNNNKQGGVIPAEDDLAKEFRFDCDTIDSMCYQTYEEHLGEGIARETARINLPISLYTEWYWQINLHNLFHFLKLRMDPHAQYEIRVYADALYELVKPIVPIASEAFEDYIWKAHTFSQHEMSVLKELLHDHITTEKIVGILDRESDKLSKRERAEFRNKIGF